MPKAEALLRACGTFTYRGRAHGCGAGFTVEEAFNAAAAEAALNANAAALSWAAARQCPIKCPHRRVTLTLPISSRTKRGDVTMDPLPKTLFKTVTDIPQPGGIPPFQIIRLCIVIVW